jgi:hypothetical protein
MGAEQLSRANPVVESKKVKRSFLEQAGVPGGLAASIVALAIFEPTQIGKLAVGLSGFYAAWRAIEAFAGRK